MLKDAFALSKIYLAVKDDYRHFRAPFHFIVDTSAVGDKARQ